MLLIAELWAKAVLSCKAPRAACLVNGGRIVFGLATGSSEDGLRDVSEPAFCVPYLLPIFASPHFPVTGQVDLELLQCVLIVRVSCGRDDAPAEARGDA